MPTKGNKGAEYELTKHAQDVLARRKIPAAWVQEIISRPTLREPDQVDAELEHRLGRIVQHGNRVLRVVVIKRTSPVKVVTAFFDRKMRDKI